MFKKVFGWIPKGLKELWTFGVHAGGEAVGKMAVEHVKTEMEHNPRPEVMEVLRKLEQGLAAKIMDRLDHAEKTGEPDLENHVMGALGHVIPHDKERNIKMTEALEIYTWIAGFDDKRFAIFVGAMKHDPFSQYVKFWIGKKGLAGLQYVAGFVFMAVELGGQELNEASRRAVTAMGPRVGTMRGKLQGWSSELDRKTRELQEKKPFIGGKRRWIF